MATGPLRAVVRHLHTLAGLPSVGEQTDQQLLERFAAESDEAAFTELVRRHGPLVWGTCWRVLRHAQDVEDAFQATFLALARKAATLRQLESVGGWLYGVAHRVAADAQRKAARRQQVTRAAGESLTERKPESTCRDLCAALEEELYQLPERYRSPLLLCYLEGQTRDQAARQLGWSLRTLDRRLNQGRERLQARLTRRGLTLSGALLAAAVGQQAARGSMPMALSAAVVAMATEHGPVGTGAGVVSARVAALVEGAVKGSALSLMKVVLILVAVAGVVVAGTGLLVPRAPMASTDSPKPQATPPLHTDLYGDPLPSEASARLGTARFRNGHIRYLAYTPDGKLLIASGQRGVSVMDAATGKELRRLGTELNNTFGATALSPDGKLLAFGSDGQDMGGVVYEVATGRPVSRFGKRGRHALPTGFSPDGHVLAVDAFANTIELYDPATGVLLRSLEWRNNKASWSEAEETAFMPDGKTLLSTGRPEGVIRFWDVASGKEVRRLTASAESVAHMALSPDGSRLATICFAPKQLTPSSITENRVQVWDTASGKEVAQLIVPEAATEQGRSRGLHLVTFTPDSKALVTCGRDHAVRVWNMATGKEQCHLPNFRGFPQAVAFPPDGKSIAVAEFGMTVSLHTLDEFGMTVRLHDLSTGRDLLPTAGHRAGIWGAAASSDDRIIATGGDDGVVLLWDRATGRELRRLDGQQVYVRSVAFSPDNRSLFALGNDQTHLRRTLRAWDVTTGRELWRFHGEPAEMQTLASSPDGKVLAVAGPERVLLLDAATGKQPRGLTGPRERPITLAFSSDGRTLHASGEGRHLHRWDVATGVHTQKSCEGLGDRRAWATTFSPDGQLLVLGGWAPNLAIVDVATGRIIRRLEGKSAGYSGSVFGVAFSPDGRTLAWAGPVDGVIRLVEVATGQERHHLTGPRWKILALTFTADGQSLISAAEDTTALVWDLSGKLGADRQRPVVLSPENLASSWADLAGRDAGRAYVAVRRLAADPLRSVPFLGARLPAAAPLEDRRLAGLIANLDSSSFAAREAAVAELEQLGERVEQRLREALAMRPSLEARRRIETLQDRLGTPSGERLRALRAVEVLERAGTAEAREVLARLSNGVPEARLTQEAKASLERPARRIVARP
jgi:RNA polymerase sigma factor (sigma-70 family)